MAHSVNDLFVACRAGDAETIKSFLAKNSFNYNTTNNSGRTALMLASISGNSDAVMAVITAGQKANLNINATNQEGCSSLTCAADQGHHEICALLLRFGADVNLASTKGSTPLMHSCFGGHTRVVEVLIAAGAHVNKPSSDGWSPLLHAANGGHVKIVELLLQAGADVNCRSKTAVTPLMRASGRGRNEVLKLLIKYGADVDAVNDNGCSALIFSAANGHADCCQTLVAAGASLMIRDKQNLSPIDAAVKHSEFATEAYLRSVMPQAPGASALPRALSSGISDSSMYETTSSHRAGIYGSVSSSMNSVYSSKDDNNSRVDVVQQVMARREALRNENPKSDLENGKPAKVITEAEATNSNSIFDFFACCSSCRSDLRPVAK